MKLKSTSSVIFTNGSGLLRATFGAVMSTVKFHAKGLKTLKSGKKLFGMFYCAYYSPVKTVFNAGTRKTLPFDSRLFVYTMQLTGQFSIVLLFV